MEAIIPVTLAMSAVAVSLQFYRVARNRTIGVSSTTWAVVSFMSIGWAAYFYANPPSRLFAAIPMFIYAVMGYYITVKANASKPVLFLWIPLSWLGIVSLTIASPSIGITILSFVTAFMYIPQAHLAVRSVIGHTSLDGVSKAAWAWNCLVSSCWLGTAIHLKTIPAIASNTFTFICAVIITVSVILTERHTKSLVEATSGL